MAKKLSLIFTVLAIVSMLLVPAIYADGSITGTVYGNGSVSADEGTEGITFTFAPGTANELKSFTVNGEAVTVTDNKVTVDSASTYEAVFEGKTQEVTREIKYLMENGAVAEDGLSATDSVNNLTAKWNSNIDKTQPVVTPVAGQYGYLLSRNDSSGISKEKWEIARSVSCGGLVNVASGRSYTAGVYFMNTHKTWGNNVWGSYHINTGYLNGGTEKVFVNNCESTWQIMSETLTNKGISKDAITKISLAPFEVSSINQKGGAEVTDKAAYSTIDQITVDTSRCGGYSGDGGGLIYVHGIGFEEKTSYHTVTANIGEGEMTFSSESLNFGKDNDNVKVKDGVALAVEDNRPAAFTVTAPSGKTVKEVKFGDYVLTADNGVYTIPCVSADGAITVTYEDKAPETPEGYEKTFNFAAYDTSGETEISYLTPYANSTVTFEFYDNGVTGGLVAFKDNDASILSEYLKLYDSENYTFVADRGTPLIGNAKAEIARSAGAHTMVIRTFTDSYDVYLDNNLVHTVKLDGNTSGIKKITVQNKNKYYVSGTPQKLYYKPITSVENKPAVSATEVIANSVYEGQPSAVIYAKVEGTANSAGIILKDASGHELTLNAYNSDNSLVTAGAFGIRVFGSAMVSGSEYKAAPFIKIADGEDVTTVTSEDKSFILGE